MLGSRTFRLHSGLCDSISEISVPPDDSESFSAQLEDLEERLARTRERYESMIEELRANSAADRKEIAALQAEVQQLRSNTDASLDEMYLWGAEAGKAAAIAAIDQMQNRFKTSNGRKLSSSSSDASSSGTAATLSSTRSHIFPKCLRTESKKQLYE
ncbi:hypothetical protein WJX73_004417 [Symbiochloris irregularis]|uniref:Uncharacterized protein n=1 Tax=Symbiochloris irregularis TaxID=706552 RepID=A0AAW1PRL3_9CHLO